MISGVPLIEHIRASDERSSPDPINCLGKAEKPRESDIRADFHNTQVEAWFYSLMWCESRGKADAENPLDLDGTPSYGCFQFKPETMRHYASKYGLLSATLTLEEYKNYAFDCDFTKQIVFKMLSDTNVLWEKEFPDCVRRLGKPPISVKIAG